MEASKFIRQNKLKVNVSKSSFTVINSDDKLDKLPIKIDGGFMSYQEKIDYLGVIISDSG